MYDCPAQLAVQSLLFFFLNDTAPTEIYTLPLHAALPLSAPAPAGGHRLRPPRRRGDPHRSGRRRSEEHTSELQSHLNLGCRLLLGKKGDPRLGHTAAPEDTKPHRTDSQTRVECDPPARLPLLSCASFSARAAFFSFLLSRRGPPATIPLFPPAPSHSS